MLDALVQASVVSKDVTEPPSLPVDGTAYVVPAGAPGDWFGREGTLAVWQENVWVFHAPNEGWTVWVSDLDTLWSYDGATWVEIAPPESWQNQPMLGINTTADATNRLAVSAATTLLTGNGAGHQLKINKATGTDTASLLYQSNWRGHAEMGLAGSNDFTIKTSDGVSWFTALQCASATGWVSFPVGVSGAIEVFDTGNSVFLGEGACASDDLSDNRNTFVGKNAGYSNTIGDFNVAVGMGALQLNTSGRQNTCLGYAPLYNNQSGSNNIALGPYALFNNSSGVNNTACGMNAALLHKSGSERSSPFPERTYPTGTVTGIPSAV